MKLLFDDIFQGLKHFLESESQHTPIVTTFPSGRVFPNVVVEKSDDRELASDNARNTVISNMNIEINIYAIDEKNVSRRTIAVELEELIKEYMGETMRFKRISDKPTPNVDNSVYRITLQYQTIINNKRKSFI